MKKLTFSITRNQLISLVVAIPLLFILYSFVDETSPEDDTHGQISVEEARTLYNTNKGSMSPFGGSIQGFAISSEMYDAMKSIDGRVSPDGFRMYFGKDEEGGDRAIIVGINSQGSDMTSFIEEASSVSSFAACPPVCDSSSEITNGN